MNVFLSKHLRRVADNLQICAERGQKKIFNYGLSAQTFNRSDNGITGLKNMTIYETPKGTVTVMTWEEYQRKKMKDLFGNEIQEPERPKVNKSAIQMHADLLTLNGSHPGKCKDCIHFKVKQHSHRYFKCDLAIMNSSPNTDWRANWQACGKFELKP